MNSRQGTEANLRRLEAVQTRVRALVGQHPRLAEEMRRAVDGYIVLLDRYRAHLAARRAERLGLACGVLERGLLGQTLDNDDEPVAFVKVRGRWPRMLAAEIHAARAATGKLPRELEQRAARAALAGMDREQPEPVAGLSEAHGHGSDAERCEEIEDCALERFELRIKVRRPEGREQPPDPASLELRDLRKLGDADFRTVALYRLSGIADVGAVRPVVPEPASTVSSAEQVAAWAAWDARLPRRLSRNPPSENSLEACEFPADVAEQMLECVRKLVPERGASANADADPFVPADSFPKHMRGRLRHATRIDRKTRRVRSRVENGVKLYSLSDARKHWPFELAEYQHGVPSARHHA